MIALLATLKYPVVRQGSLSPSDPYPPTFFTFWNVDETGQSFYDNQDAAVEHDFRVCVYSSTPALAYSLLTEARALLKQNGWIITDRGYDVASDEFTHVGRGMTVTFLERKNIE